MSKTANRFSKFFGRSNSGGAGASASAAAKPAPAAAPGAAPAATPPATAKSASSGTPTAAPNSSTSTSPAAAPAPASAPHPPAKDESPPAPAAGSHLPSYSKSARSLAGLKSGLREQYPHVAPYRTGKLKVAEESEGGHELYWELSGKEGGYPVVYLHGGPGGGISDGDRRWFDPKHYQILTFDQRGSGKSTPSAELKNNTTWDLVEDIEKLRTQVAKVQKWHVFGGSWGSTLSLAYAQKYPERVSALVLRGIFTLRRAELLFFYQHGSGYLWPEQFKPFEEHIPVDERDDMIAAYYKRVTSDDYQTRLEAARKWSTWENATSKLYLDDKHVAKGEDDKWALEFARIESHFFHNRGWMEDGQLLKPENVARIAHIPTVVVQGRYDVVCPAKSAWDLRESWLQCPGGDKTLEFFMIPDAGHSAKEPGIMDKLMYATDKFRAVR